MAKEVAMDDKKRERDRRYREKKKKMLEQAAIAPAPAEAPVPEADADLYYAPKPKTPSQLDRIEALLLELVETNRKMHPNISEALGGF
jgi:hypothetical protein